ncbi:MAG: transferrin-binding protein-like solute binding protein [Nitrospinae bacterium]|nr:transferrin-binding protein-like solute binding protein [Nitrospinota bacterium]
MRNAKQRFSLALFSFAMVAAFALSGCGGGGGGAAMDGQTPMPGGGGQQMPGTGGGQTPTDPPTDPPTPMPYVVDGLVANPSTSFIAESAADTRESVLAGGETLAPLTVGIDRNLGTGPDRGVTAPKDGMTYLKSISSDGAGGYHVNYVLGGEETPVHFTAADVYQNREFDYRKQMDDGSGYWLQRRSSFFSSLFTYFDGSSWRYFPASYETELDRRGVTIYGARTAPENLPAMGSAIYEGRMYADIWNADDPSFNSSRTNFNSRLTLKANFGDGEISGWTNRFRVTDSRDEGNVSGWLGIGNLITISGGEIDDGRFTADWTGSDSDMSRAPEDSMGGFSGKMLGEFFGPAGEEVGGVLNGSRAATSTTSEQHLFGFFGAIGRPLRDVRDSTGVFEPDLSASVEQEFSGADMGVRTPDQGEAYVKSIANDGAGGRSVTYVINGVETVINFSAADVYPNTGSWGKVVGDKDYAAWRYTYFDPLGLNYVDVTGWGRDINDSAGGAIKRYRGYNVHGVATENLPTTGSATYEGRMYADAWDVTDAQDSSGRTRFIGNVMLEANFGNSGVAGQIDGLRIRNPGERNFVDMASGNSIGISNGAIAGNGFTADWTGMDTNANSAYGDSVRGFSGTMSGGFYGPAAEEVGGLMNGSRAATDQILVGGFGAKKME